MKTLETLNNKYETILGLHSEAVELRFSNQNEIDRYYENGLIYDDLTQRFYELDENNLKEEYDDESICPTDIIDRIKRDLDLYSVFINCIYDEVKNEVGSFHDYFTSEYDDEDFMKYQKEMIEKFDELLERLENIE